MAEKKNKNVHHGHRQRVKERFLTYGVESFNEIQLLEALLFYGIPKKDTNDTAHLLLDTFGSFKKVLEADYKELVRINGIGENAASLIKFFQMASKKYLEFEYTKTDDKVYNTPESLMDFCKRLFLGERKEKVYAIALDDDLVILDTALISEGNPDSVYIPYRKVADFIIKLGVSRIVLAHNHPNGVCLPSRNDIDATKDIIELLEQIDVEVVDHIVVGKKGTSSMRNSQLAREVWRNGHNGKI